MGGAGASQQQHYPRACSSRSTRRALRSRRVTAPPRSQAGIGLGAGGIKPNISPFGAEQIEADGREAAAWFGARLRAPAYAALAYGAMLALLPRAMAGREPFRLRALTFMIQVTRRASRFAMAM